MYGSRYVSITAALAAMLAGCSSTPVAPPASAAPAKPQPVGVSPVTTIALPPYLDPKDPVSTERSVFFDFDDTRIKTEYAPVIVRQGNYLAGNSALAVKVEGNCDERGSSEYNLALGQERAQAVVQALEIYRVKDAQMEAISWGKERPRATGHDEAAWAQNRRADIVYPPK